jgi:hypothetical protein
MEGKTYLLGGGGATERGRGFSGTNAKSDTDGQLYLTIPYMI